MLSATSRAMQGDGNAMVAQAGYLYRIRVCTIPPHRYLRRRLLITEGSRGENGICANSEAAFHGASGACAKDPPVETSSLDR